jgi:hypothetical protein
MRQLAAVCLIVSLLLSGCVEQRHMLRHLWSPNTTDTDGKPLPRWVHSDDFQDRHPYLFAAGCVAVATAVVLGVVVLVALANMPENETGHSP